MVAAGAVQWLNMTACGCLVVVQIVCLFQEGVLIMDEVDLVLHPMKSELNFPTGRPRELPLRDERATVSMRLLFAVLKAGKEAHALRGTMLPRLSSADVEESPFRALVYVLHAGMREWRLSCQPHLVLVDVPYYHARCVACCACCMGWRRALSDVRACVWEQHLARRCPCPVPRPVSPGLPARALQYRG